MKKFDDARPSHGDLVMVRGTYKINVYSRVDDVLTRVGIVKPGVLGIVVSAGWSPGGTTFFTYVLWSSPNIIGWSSDGQLRKV